MALDASKWQVQTNKAIRYIGGDHGTATTNYVTVLELHRWLQDLADDASVSGDDFMDITTVNPSDKKYDTIITLTNGYNLDDAYTTPASEFIYGGSIIQGTGGTEAIYDGISVVANRGVKVNVIQDGAVLSNDFWNSVPDGSKTDSTATVSGVNSTGQKVLNVSDGSLFVAGDTIMIGTVVDEEYLVDSVAANALTLTENLGTATSGGETVYFSVRGINSDPSTGVAMRFMVKVRDSGADIDNKALLFTTREWFSTFSGFRIPATGRGVNVVPLSYSTDLNNTTPIATVAAYSGITNVTSGWNNIDVDQDSTDEYYYSEWNRATYTINQFYQWMKWSTRAGMATTLYGLAGELFRGITHSVEFTGAATPSPFSESNRDFTWGSGATAGTGQLLAMDTTNHIAYIQLLTGVVPTDSMSVSDGTNSATTIGSDSVVEKAVSTPVCGQSTGTSLVGAYGFSLEYADLAVNDKITALDGITRQPPNNVQFTVQGIQTNWRILVGPEDGAGALKYDQLTSDVQLTGASVSSVVYTEAVPANTPSTNGTLRIHRADGSYTRHPYDTHTPGTKTFALSTPTNFSTNNGHSDKKFFISYIDADSGGTSISFNTVQTTEKTLFVEARYAGTGPDYTDSIKPAKTTGTLGSTGGSATISSVSDA